MAEKQDIEYKESWRDEYLKWICGYANAYGGKLFIGKNDDGKTVGLKDTKKLMEDIPNKLQNMLGIIADVDLHEDNDGSCIEISVPEYPVGVSYKGVYYYRSGSTLQTLTGLALEEFLLHKRGATWDHSPLPVFKMEDVDEKIVESFKKRAAKKGRIEPELLDEPKEVLLEKLRLTNGDYLTNAAMLLFSDEPDRYELGSYIKIGYFETDADLVYQDEIHGSVLEQADKAVELIYLKYMKAKISYEGIQRVERYFVPEDALREALLNAICHKQYQARTPIQVSVYEDRLYVANVCSLPSNWTQDNLMKKHASRPYNPDIAHVFYLAGFIESWGRGVEKICEALEADDLPMPEYTVNPTDIMIKFTGPEDKIVRVNNRVNDKVNDRVNVHLTEKEQILLEHLYQDPGYTITELSGLIGVSRKSVAGYIKSLKEKDIIRRVGSDRKGYWRIIQ